MGPYPSWYPNPIYATHPMMETMSQFVPLIVPIALINVPPYMVQPTVTIGLGASRQNPLSQILVS